MRRRPDPPLPTGYFVVYRTNPHAELRAHARRDTFEEAWNEADTFDRDFCTQWRYVSVVGAASLTESTLRRYEDQLETEGTLSL